MKIKIYFPTEYIKSQCDAFSTRTLGWASEVHWPIDSELPTSIVVREHYNADMDEDQENVHLRLDWKLAIECAILEHPMLLDESRRDAIQADAWFQLAAFGYLEYA